MVAVRRRSRQYVTCLIGQIRALAEPLTLGRTLCRRGGDVLAYFDGPGTSDGPSEATNGRLERLRGTALGLRKPTNHILRSLLDIGGIPPRLHPLL